MSLRNVASQVLVAAVLALGCAGDPSPVGIWRNPPSHTEEMRLTFCPGGELEFTGGFVFFNPSKWQQDVLQQELRITLGGTKWLREALQWQLENRPLTLRGFNEESRTLVYPFDRSTETLDFGGYVFFRELGSDVARRLTRHCS